MVKVAILGVKGYAGRETADLLLRHDDVDISFLGSRDKEKEPLSKYLPGKDTRGLLIEEIDDKKIEGSDVLFLALPHTKSIDFVERFYGSVKLIVDLSADYRFKNLSVYKKWYKAEHKLKDIAGKAVYGLSEIMADEIFGKKIIANPGCYPTSVLLPLIPLVKESLVDTSEVIIDSKSGVSGAGRKIAEPFMFSELWGNFYPYKVARHQHMPEIKEVLESFAADRISVAFVPHLLPIERGILSVIYVKPKGNFSLKAVYDVYDKYYSDKPFVRIKPENVPPRIKDVAYTNYCDISVFVSEETGHLILISAIDNLLKGAAGQAVQNMNIALGIEETKGII